LVIDRLTHLRGRRVVVEGAGNGTRAVAFQLLEVDKLDDGNTTISNHGGNDAANKLINGELDAAMVIASARSALVSRLIRSPGISIMNFTRYEVYTRRNHSLSSVRLPQGAIDLSTNLSPTHTTLLAREGLHPALINLFVQTAKQVH
jgi:TRAP-type uncharacterized transport system substrate-binding protein